MASNPCPPITVDKLRLAVGIYNSVITGQLVTSPPSEVVFHYMGDQFSLGDDLYHRALRSIADTFAETGDGRQITFRMLLLQDLLHYFGEGYHTHGLIDSNSERSTVFAGSLVKAVATMPIDFEDQRSLQVMCKALIDYALKLSAE